MHRLNLLQSCWCLELASITYCRMSSYAFKGGREHNLAAILGYEIKMSHFKKPLIFFSYNFFDTTARMLIPRCVCCESWLLQNMLISAWSVLNKVVTFVCVFFGFSLHHLFMHMKYFWSPLGLRNGLGLHRVILGVLLCSCTDGMGWWLRGGHVDVTGRTVSAPRNGECQLVPSSSKTEVGLP